MKKLLCWASVIVLVLSPTVALSQTWPASAAPEGWAKPVVLCSYDPSTKLCTPYGWAGVSTALSGTIAASGSTATIALTRSTKTEILNPSTAALWASYGSPSVNGAGSFKIAPDGAYIADRVAGTLTLLSTTVAQPYSVNRFN